jgi:hypothetical protein
MMPTKQRKKPVQRRFSGLVGLPPEPEPAPVVAEQVAEPAPPKRPMTLAERKSIAEPVPPQSAIKDSVKGRCLKHGELTPCQKCFVNAFRTDAEWEIRAAKQQEQQKYVDVINSINTALYEAQEEIRKAIAGKIHPDQKCVHGMYLAEHYCEVCRWEPIDPSYNTETYRIEISKALSHTRLVLRGDEGQKDHKDLQQLVDIEIWKTAKKYGDKMTAALAYTVARNQRGKFLADRIEEQTVLVVDGDGNPMLDEFGHAEGLTGAELKRTSLDPNATPKERLEAKKLIERYSQRIPRFSSFDDKPEEDTGKESDASPAEKEVIRRESEGGAGDWMQAFLNKGGLPALLQLISTWHGAKRLVAEAMLQPGFTVRSVTGLDKSKVSRIYPAVVKTFKAFITQDLKDFRK